MGMAGYLPAGCFRESAFELILEAADVCFAKTSAPDANGYLSFGPARWTNRTLCDISKKTICEVELISVAHPDFRAELRADAAARYHVWPSTYVSAEWAYGR